MKVFVSSTYEDLKDHRARVIAFLRKSGAYVDPQEDWSAATGEPKRFSQDRVRGCHLCVLLVGFRRGTVPAGETLSITQLEYRAAVEQNMDVLAFLLAEQAPWPRNFDELDKDPDIRRWREELMQSRGVGFFDNDPLSVEIEPAWSRWLLEKLEKRHTEIELERLLQELPLEKSRPPREIFENFR